MRAAILCTLLLTGVTAFAEEVPVREIVVPRYNLVARGARLQGSVRLQLEINRDGKAQSVKASGADPLLLKESEKNIRLWTFGPFSKGTAFPVSLEVYYVYKLQGEPEYPMSQPEVVITLPNRIQIVARPPKPIID